MEGVRPCPCDQCGRMDTSSPGPRRRAGGSAPLGGAADQRSRARPLEASQPLLLAVPAIAPQTPAAAIRTRQQALHPVVVLAALAAAIAVALDVPLVADASCVVDNCNGHGVCSRGGGGVDTCVCNTGWHGVDCNRRECPTGKAWVGPSDSGGNSHFDKTLCSSKGVCNNQTGVCDCFTGFTGAACDRMVCPTNDTSKVCSGHGRCLSMRDAAKRINQTRGPTAEQAYDYDKWDADMVHGCVCDPTWQGYDCTRRKCPTGDDPLSTGQYEIQTVRTTATHTDEIQSFSLSLGAGDTNEIQTFYVEDVTTGKLPLTGHIKLIFDTSTPSNCYLCGTFASQTTARVDIATGASSDAAFEAALEALTNIDDVTVSSTDRSPQEGRTWTVTFVGTEVGGDVPQLTIYLDGSESILYGDSVTYGQATAQTGNHVNNYITVSYDDTDGSNRPVGTGGASTSAAIYPYYTAAQIATTLTNMDSIGTTTVTKTLSGGPDMSFTVTFTENLGDMIDITCNDGTLTGTCTQAEVQQGNYISGSYTLTFDGQTTGSFTFNQDAATISTALEALDEDHGQIDVSVARYYPTTVAEDVGANVWSITFRQLIDDVSDITVTPTLGGAQGTEAIAVGTESSQVTGGEKDAVLAQVSEVQLIECTCSVTCSGSFKVDIGGRLSDAINYNDNAAAVKTALESLRSIEGVTVNQYGGTEVCDATGVTTAITFSHTPGDVDDLEIAEFTIATDGATLYFDVVGTDGTEGLQGAVVKRGTRENVECSNRGECDYDTGLCTCWAGFDSGDGAGNIIAPSQNDIRQDCGYSSGVTACSGPTWAPNGPCEGRGTCSGSPQYLCTCDSGYSGGACEKKDCPTGNAWFDFPTAIDTAHASTECSARGHCDSRAGVCTCDGFPFDKDAGATGACNQMDCPHSTCNGKGTCYSMTALAPLSTNSDGDFTSGVYNTEWDASMIFGCSCSEFQYWGDHFQSRGNYTNPACTERVCVTGDDPLTTGQSQEVQTVTCSHTSGSFTLTFRTKTTVAIAYDAPATGDSSVEEALEALSTVTNVTVSFDGANTDACSATPTVMSVTFIKPSGNVPALTYTDAGAAGGSMSVATTTTGTTEDAECSNRGVCNGRTGQCHCAACYGASDGQGNAGQVKDCGFIHAKLDGDTLPIQWATAGVSPVTETT